MRKQSYPYLSILILLTFLLPNALAADEPRPSAQTVIARSDAVRNPDKPFRLNLRLSEYVDGALRNEVILRVYAKTKPETTKQHRQFRPTHLSIHPIVNQ